jgi:hypothetical protein
VPGSTSRAWLRVSASAESLSASGERAKTSSSANCSRRGRCRYRDLPQPVQRGGELVTRLSDSALPAQRSPRDRLDTGGRSRLAEFEVAFAGAARVLDRCGPVGTSHGGFGGAFPQRICGWLGVGHV